MANDDISILNDAIPLWNGTMVYSFIVKDESPPQARPAFVRKILRLLEESDPEGSFNNGLVIAVMSRTGAGVSEEDGLEAFAYVTHEIGGLSAIGGAVVIDRLGSPKGEVPWDHFKTILSTAVAVCFGNRTPRIILREVSSDCVKLYEASGFKPFDADPSSYYLDLTIPAGFPSFPRVATP